MNLFVANIILVLSGLTLAKLDVSKICLTNKLDDVVHNPEDCSSYIVCALKPAIQYCEDGLHYDAKRKVCNWPQYAGCKLEPQPTEMENEIKEVVIMEPSLPEVREEDNKYYSSFIAIDVMTGATIDPLIDYDPQQVVCRHFGAYFLPHPLQCRSYFLCAYGHIHKQSCGLGTMWNYKKQQCEISVRAECYHKSSEEVKEIASFIPTTTDNPLMVCYALVPTSTTTTAGVYTNTWHPTGSIYSATATTTAASTLTTTMSLSTSTTSKSSSKPKTSSTATSTKTPNSLNPFLLECPSKIQSYIAHPKDCSKYYMCIMGMPVLTSCPVGLFWDSKMEYCDWPNHVNCFQ